METLESLLPIAYVLAYMLIAIIWGDIRDHNNPKADNYESFVKSLLWPFSLLKWFLQLSLDMLKEIYKMFTTWG